MEKLKIVYVVHYESKIIDTSYYKVAYSNGDVTEYKHKDDMPKNVQYLMVTGKCVESDSYLCHIKHWFPKG